MPGLVGTSSRRSRGRRPSRRTVTVCVSSTCPRERPGSDILDRERLRRRLTAVLDVGRRASPPSGATLEARDRAACCWRLASASFLAPRTRHLQLESASASSSRRARASPPSARVRVRWTHEEVVAVGRVDLHQLVESAASSSPAASPRSTCRRGSSSRRGCSGSSRAHPRYIAIASSVVADSYATSRRRASSVRSGTARCQRPSARATPSRACRVLR